MDPDYVPVFPAAEMNGILKPPSKSSKPVSPSLCYTTRRTFRRPCNLLPCSINLLAAPTPKSNRQPLPAPDAVRNVRVYSVQKNTLTALLTVRSMTNGRW